MKIQINYENFESTTVIPSVIIDRFLKTCSGDGLRVILYIFKNNCLDIATIASGLKLDITQVEDAIDYWVEQGVLKTDDSEIVIAKHTVPETKTTGNVTVHSKSPKLDRREIAEKINGDPHIKYLVTETERLLGKPLSYSDYGTIISLHTWAGLPVEVLLVVISYCNSIGKPSIRSIEKEAIKWLDAGIDTSEKAEKYIVVKEQSNVSTKEIKQLFGIENRKLSTKEREFAMQWLVTDGFSSSLIKLAYDKTIDAKGKVTFPYINSILQRWKKDGLTTTAEVTEMDKRWKEQNLKNKTSLDLQKADRDNLDNIPVYKRRGE